MKKKMKDLSGDGKVTKKDVLIGRGVIKRRMGGTMGGGMNPMGRSKDPTVRNLLSHYFSQSRVMIIHRQLLVPQLVIL